MSALRLEVGHRLPLESAAARMGRLGDRLQARHGVRVAWVGQQASFSGRIAVVKIAGRLLVGPTSVLVEAEDPGFLFRSKATSYLRAKLEQYLDPAVPLEQLPAS